MGCLALSCPCQASQPASKRSTTTLKVNILPFVHRLRVRRPTVNIRVVRVWSVRGGCRVRSIRGRHWLAKYYDDGVTRFARGHGKAKWVWIRMGKQDGTAARKIKKGMDDSRTATAGGTHSFTYSVKWCGFVDLHCTIFCTCLCSCRPELMYLYSSPCQGLESDLQPARTQSTHVNRDCILYVSPSLLLRDRSKA